MLLRQTWQPVGAAGAQQTPISSSPLALYADHVRRRIASHKFYPDEARRTLEEGRVVLELAIRPDGSAETG